jgi:putative cardiolipin synthase
MARRGVRVRIATNSLASTNHRYVHGAYARYRDSLLAQGVEFLEVRADEARLNGAGDRPLTMQAKLVVIDSRVLFVGSSNVDARSTRQNTEIGMVIKSPRFGRNILERIEVAAPDYTFDVFAGPDGAPF